MVTNKPWMHWFVSHLIYLSLTNPQWSNAFIQVRNVCFTDTSHLVVWTFFSCWRWNLVLFCQFTVVHFALISNTFLCRYASRTLRMKLLTRCRVISRAGIRLRFVKIFRACIQHIFITLRVTIFFFRDIDLLRSPR